MNIYVASSWRNEKQQEAVKALRAVGYDVYDFKNPEPGNQGFHWSEIDKYWKDWSPKKFIQALNHPIAKKGFKNDWEAMQKADACLLLMPSGRSAHLEAGYFVGAKKLLIILVTESEPELMYKMSSKIVTTIDEAIEELYINELGLIRTTIDKSRTPIRENPLGIMPGAKIIVSDHHNFKKPCAAIFQTYNALKSFPWTAIDGSRVTCWKYARRG